MLNTIVLLNILLDRSVVLKVILCSIDKLDIIFYGLFYHQAWSPDSMGSPDDSLRTPDVAY